MKEQSTFKELLRSCTVSSNNRLAQQGIGIYEPKRGYGKTEFQKLVAAGDILQDQIFGMGQKPRFMRPHTARTDSEKSLKQVDCVHRHERNGFHPDILKESRHVKPKDLSSTFSDPEDSSGLASWVQATRTLLEGKLFTLGIKPDVESILQQARDVVVRSMQCERAVVFVDYKSNGFLYKNGWTGLQFSPNRGVAGHVFRNCVFKEPFNLSEVERCPHFDKDIDSTISHGEIRSFVSCAAIDPQGKVRGVIHCLNRVGRNQFDKVDEFVLQSICQQLAMVLGLLLEVQVNPERIRSNAMDSEYNIKLHQCIHSGEVIQLACQYVSDYTQADLCTFQGINPFGNIINESEEPKIAKSRKPGKEQLISFLNRVLRVGGMAIVNDLMFDIEHSKMFDKDPTPRRVSTGSISRWRPNSADEKTSTVERRSCLGIALRPKVGYPAVGVVIASHPEPSHFTKEMAANMEKMLICFASVLERTATMERFVTVQELLPDLLSSIDIQNTVLRAEALAAKCLHASSACIYVVNQANGQVWLTSTSKIREEMDASKGLVGQCLREAERWERESKEGVSVFEVALLNIKDAMRDPRFSSSIDDAKCYMPSQIKPMLVLPIQIPSRPNKVAAVLSVSRCQPKPFCSTDEIVARVLSRTIAACFQNCLNNEMVEHVIKDTQNLLKVTAELHGQQDTIEEMMASILMSLLDVLQATSATIFLPNAVDMQKHSVDQDQSIQLRSFRIFDGRVEEQLLDLFAIEEPNLQEALSEHALVNNCQFGANSADLRSDGWHPTMCCPLFNRADENSLIGVIKVDRAASSLFSEIDEAKLTFFCQHVGAVVKHAIFAEEQEKVITALQAENAQYKKFCMSIPNLTNKLHLESIVNASAKLAKDLVCCGSSKFFWRSESDFHKHSASEAWEPYLRMTNEFRGIAGEVIRTRNTAVSNNLQQEEYYDSDIDQLRDSCSCRNAIGVPIFTSSEGADMIGVLVLYNKYVISQENSYKFSDNDVEIANLIAQLTTFCLRIARKEKKHDLLGSLINIMGKEGSSWNDVGRAAADIGAHTFLVFETSMQRPESLVCTFPLEYQGQSISIENSLFGRSFRDGTAVVNVKDSHIDQRVNPKEDSLPFLNLVETRRLRQAPSKSLEQAAKNLKEPRKVPWKTALSILIPSYEYDAHSAGIVLVINKIAEPFNGDDEKTLQILVRITAKQNFEILQRLHLNSEIQARSEIIQYAYAALRLRSASQLFENVMKMSIAKVRSLIDVHYCSIYVREDFSKGKRVQPIRDLDILFAKLDSDGCAASERSSEGAHTQAYLTGTPLRIDDATGVEASGVPAAHRKENRSILAHPIVAGIDIFGVVLLANKKDNTVFAEHEELLVKDFCTVLALALMHCESVTREAAAGGSSVSLEHDRQESKQEPLMKRRSFQAMSYDNHTASI